MTSAVRLTLLWLAVAVPAPLLFFNSTHRWEENQPVTSAAWWGVATIPLLTAALSAHHRHPPITARSPSLRPVDATHSAPHRPAGAAHSAPRDPRRAPHLLRRLAVAAQSASRRLAVAALLGRRAVVAALVGVALVAAGLAVFRWVIPLQGSAPWSILLVTGVTGAVLGAVAGRLLPARRPPQPTGRWHWIVAALALTAGAFLFQTTIRLGAEDSTIRYDEGRHGQTGNITLPSSGTYAILAVGPAPTRPDCTITPGNSPPTPVTIPPADYGGDAATYTWIATFDIPEPGPYNVDCGSSTDYVIGDVPEIRGAVSTIIFWPLPLILLLGSAPGALLALSTWRDNRYRATQPS